MLSYHSLLDILKKFCNTLKIPRVTVHELRHSCSELFAEQGGSAEDIRRLLNHSSVSAVAPYMHRTDDRLKGIANRVSQNQEMRTLTINDNQSDHLQLIH